MSLERGAAAVRALAPCRRPGFARGAAGMRDRSVSPLASTKLSKVMAPATAFPIELPQARSSRPGHACRGDFTGIAQRNPDPFGRVNPISTIWER